MNKRRWSTIIGILVLAGLLGYALFDFFQPARVQADIGATVGKRLPDFTLADLDGQQVTISGQHGAAVVNFWATWCPPCREEMPELNDFYRNNKQSVRFYAVNIQEPPEKVRQFIQQHQYDFPVVLDQDAAVAKLFQINAIPTTLVVDKHGIIQYRKAGGVTRAELEAVIEKL